MVEPIGRAYKPWIIASVGVLVGSLLLLAGTVGAAFFYFSKEGTPVWVVVLGGRGAGDRRGVWGILLDDAGGRVEGVAGGTAGCR